MAITSIFVNLPVADVRASTAFYEAVGASVNPDFSDETSTSLVLSGAVYIQIMNHEKFASFTKQPIAADGIEVINALGVESREEVDRIAGAALVAGGTETDETKDIGWMYGRAFADLDGHHWEVMFMDEAAMAEAFAAEAG
ncbi:VOC family protein [Promicromonospora sp. NPDC060204]|uniref:VOC family protein n=1 Tax=Promicromonospora sp. NPDC060204 TaxID=3347071 RepID=UPI0036469BD3